MSRRARWSACLGAAAVLASGCAQLVEVEPLGTARLRTPDRTSVVVAADGSTLAELHGEQDRELVSLDRVPQALRDAVVAVEDARFWRHGGVDVRAVGRAGLRNAREGRVIQGGSTITQQLAKNAVVGAEPTLRRKLEEASVALQLEARYSKAEILEQYLNTVYFGNGAYGVQAAARRYFAVDVDRLTLAQSALLAGLLAAPSRFDPYDQPQAALSRRNLVLHLMAEQGLASRDEAAAAGAAPLGVVLDVLGQRWRAPWFVDHVLDVLQHDPAFGVLGPDPTARADLLFRGGLRIETTLDPGWQEAADRAVAETLSDPADPRAAVVAIDPATGGIRALVGGRDYYDAADPYARFNLATDGRRQPGSTFKQLVLATALARGHSLDEPYPGGASVVIPPRTGHPQPWRVDNYESRDLGPLSLREATAFSVNVVYARLIDAVGPEAVAQLAQAAGIRRALPPVRSLALGTVEVSPLEMATVQATLAAGGVYRPPTAVLRVTDAGGRVLYRRPDPAGQRVLDEGVVYLTTTALTGVVERGTGQRARLHRPTAGKTGTTQDGGDAWFAGYTPDLAAAVWIGFAHGRVPMVPPRTRVRVEGGNWPAELFARFGLRALVRVPARDFPAPALALAKVRVDVTRNCLPNPYTPPDLVAERTYVAGTQPTRTCSEPTGPPTTQVPGAVGLPLDAALRLLEGAGFAVEQRREFSVQLPPGYVVRQSPEPGPAQTAARPVTLWVSVADR
ncbi:MAG: transglycosylase domain-containing protein, partial [Actinomycetota bacterium]|nr:transglycosylase domain-containing protein [Actinomycetota bacterium]